jgi:SRSO17 transposase
MVQAEVARWVSQLTEVAERLGPRFVRAESRQRALAYVRGLLRPIERENGWQLAEQAGERQPDNCPHLRNRATWSAESVRDDLRRYVSEFLGDPQAVLVVDESGFLKKGTKSAGVVRQYAGTAGTIDHGQMGVFLAYASAKGHTWLDRAWSLPQEWLADQNRGQAAGIPVAPKFQTKPPLAQVMLERALTAGVPAKWGTGDEVSGPDRQLRLWLERWPQASVMAVPANEPVWQGFQLLRVQALIAPRAAAAWQCLSAGDGAKGPRLYDWASVPLNPPLTPDWGSWLLARPSREAPTELAYDVV